jgi:hypothetical protein
MIRFATLLQRLVVVLDAVLLLYLALTCDWTALDVRGNVESPAAMLAVPLLWAAALGIKLFFAALFLAVGLGIVRTVRTPRVPPRAVATVTATLVLVMALLAIAVAFVHAMHVVTVPRDALIDRLTLFDALTRKAAPLDALPEARHWLDGSIGAFVVLLLGAAYLAEKYLLAWWSVRWPVPLLPLLALGVVVSIAAAGEQREREVAAAQRWHPVANAVSWIDAVAACEQLGPGWRLPRREELALHLALDPVPAGASGAAWTSSVAGHAAHGIAVALQPHTGGRAHRGNALPRDASPCEARSPTDDGQDWFSRLLPLVCRHASRSPSLYTSQATPTVLWRGNVSVEQSSAGAACILPGDPRVPAFGRRRRAFADLHDFDTVAEVHAHFSARCRMDPLEDRAACFVFAPDVPAFAEDGDERLMRAFCRLAGNGEACARYADLVDRHGGETERSGRYRALACTRGFAAACASGAEIAP